CQQYNILPWTF
nr:immunoglobulin light chain junction region [Macaca mulatta]